MAIGRRHRLMSHAVRITEASPRLADLKLSWSTPVFTDEDGIGSLASLDQAGDAFVAVVQFTAEGPVVLGSGVMVGPGLVITATHVLDEFRAAGASPVFMTFLPEGARAWLPLDISAGSKPSAFDPHRTVTSDLSLVSCTLNSDPMEERPLALAPMKIGLPLIGDRLWAIGFRHQDISGRAALVSPMISSGLVTQAFPTGRGDRMSAACFEVDMETIGGMSGGAVVDKDGNLVGIVSSSLEGGPSYMTLIWDALGLRVKGPTPRLSLQPTVTLLGAQSWRLARIQGDVGRNPWGEITIHFSQAEARLLSASAPEAYPDDGRRQLTADERMAFMDEHGSELESLATEAVVDWLEGLPLDHVYTFLGAAQVPSDLFPGLSGFTIEDMEGAEDLELITAREGPGGSVAIEFFLRLQSYVWILEMPSAFAEAHAATLEAHFINIETEGRETRMERVQRAYFRATTRFDQTEGTFSEISVTSSAIIP